MEPSHQCNRYYGRWTFPGRRGHRRDWVHSVGPVQRLGRLLCTMTGANVHPVRRRGRPTYDKRPLVAFKRSDSY